MPLADGCVAVFGAEAALVGGVETQLETGGRVEEDFACFGGERGCKVAAKGAVEFGNGIVEDCHELCEAA